MKKYPKVPRYDHPVVNTEIFEHANTILLEKFDGSNCSFILYDSKFDSQYSQDILNLNPEENDLIIFSKNKLQGLESTMDKHVRGTYGDLIDYLVNIVDKSAIKKLYDEYGLLQFFVEYMREQSICEYSSDIPLAIGFDVYNISESITHDNLSTPDNKYKEKFIHFLKYSQSKKMFNKINIEPANTVPFEWPLSNPDSFEIPYSKYGDIKAEGVIIRNDTLETRYKLRSEFFKEIHKKSKCLSVSNIETEEDILDRFCPEMRIRKMINKMILDEGRELDKSLNNELYQRVNEDMWSEEYHEIMRINAEINPSKLNPMLAKRCIKVIEKMQNE